MPHDATRANRPSVPLWRLTPCSLALAMALGSMSAAHAQVAQAPSQSAVPQAFDIPAGSLADGLRRLATTAGLLMTFTSGQTDGKTTAGVRGTLTANEALGALLEGTGLRAVPLNGGYVLEAAPVAAPVAEQPARRDGGNVATLPAVTVLAARDPGLPLSNVPASISLMSRERIDAEQPTASRMEDLLSRGVPGFNPTNTGVRQIRGRTAQVFVNGVPTNEQLRASSGSDLNLLAPDQLDLIEVSRGANSAYGFGSPGGIIALYTPRAESANLTLRTRAGTSFNGRHAGDSLQTSLYQSASQIVGDFDYHVALSARRDGLSFAPDGKPALDFNSPAMFSMGKENLYSFDTSLGLKVGDAGSVRLTATAGYVDVDEHYESDATGTYRDTPSNLVHRASGDRDNRRHHTLNLSYENPRLGEHALKIEAVSSRVHERRWASDTEYLDQYNEYEGLRSSISTPLDVLKKGASVTYGLDFVRNRYYNPQIDSVTGVPTIIWGPDTTMESVAPYAQGQLPFGALHLSAGLRHERYRGSVETGVSTSGTGTTQGGDVQSFHLTLFNAGAVYSLAPDQEVYASYSQGAEVSQLSRAARSAGAASLIDPAPAKSNQYELGVRQRGQPLAYSLSVFYTESKLMSALLCAIPNEPCRPLREPREFWGVEGTADWRIDARWSTGGTLAWMDGLRKLESGEKRRIGSSESPPLMLGAHLEHSPMAGWKNRLQLDYRASRDPFNGSADWPEGRVDSLFLAHVSTSVDVGPGKLQIGVRNLFNKTYYSLVSQAYNGGYMWIPEQGRRFSLAYSAEW
jgi:iron complex outermembrane receptor protein